MSRRQSIVVALGLAFATGACAPAAPEAPPEAGPDTPLGPRIAALSEDLELGSSGDGVRALHEYLTEFGYFPSPELARRYPTWRPVVGQAPADASIFDEHTLAAVESLQGLAGLSPSGVVDAGTREVLRTPRCSVPESAPSDPSEKYALQTSRWNKQTLTWFVFSNVPDVTMADERAAARAALATWAAQTNLTFTEGTSAASDILIVSATLSGLGVLGKSDPPPPGTPGSSTNATVMIQPHPSDPGGSRVWSVASPTPTGAFDLQSELLHEIGHALGLQHTSIGTQSFGSPVMYPNFSTGFQKRALQTDDTVAISSLYDQMLTVSGTAKDIGVSASSNFPWIIGTTAAPGGFQVLQWNGGAWDVATGGRGAVHVRAGLVQGDGGFPFIVDNTGAVYQRNSLTAASGAWVQLYTGLCTKDIATTPLIVCPPPTCNPVRTSFQLWRLDCAQASDGTGFAISCSNGGPTTFPVSGGASEIAVNSVGVPFIVRQGKVYQGSGACSSSPFTWTLLTSPATGSAVDVGVSAANYVFASGFQSSGLGSELWVWDGQAAGSGSPAAPLTAKWLKYAAQGATRVTVGSNSRAWSLDNTGHIWRATK